MPKLALAQSFLESYAELEKKIRTQVDKAIEKFRLLSMAELHADKGLHLESVDKARDPRLRSIRISNFWRGVVLAPDDGSDVFLLVRVVPHDDAYAWAAKQLYTINTATHAVEVRDVQAIEDLTPPLEQHAATAPRRLFERHSDTVLRGLGIDDQVLRAARAITDDAQLDAFGNFLPEDQFEVLQFLAEGFSPEEVHRQLVAERRPVVPEPGSGPLATAIANSRNRIALVTSSDELADILDKPFAAWRVFLHRSQRRVAYKSSYNGPAQVTGGPGTGKTVVALHRVKHLLSRSPDTRVLLTTYTNALAGMLRDNLALLLDDPKQLARVDVTTVDSFAYRIVRERTGKAPVPINDIDERKLWRQLRRRFDLSWTEQFLEQEFRHVVLAQGLGTEAKYIAAIRHGRGSTTIRTVEKKRLWEAFEAFRAELRAAGKTTYLLMCDQAADRLERAGARPHSHVVVDEAQDLHPSQWRVIRAAVAESSDDLFITGDPHQRIYDSKVSLRSLGIPVTGRSSRLRINYRSTAEILTWATGLLSEHRIENLGGDGADTLAGYRSLLTGEEPDRDGYDDEHAEITAVVERIQEWLDHDVLPEEIAVCARFNVLLDKVHDRLTSLRVPAVKVKGRPDENENGVRLATMHAMKGLEFRCVADVGATASAIPFAREVTPKELDAKLHASDMLKQRCLLFVACTRARERLAVSWSGTPSPFLPARS